MFVSEQELVNKFIKIKEIHNYVEEYDVRWGNIDVISFDFKSEIYLNLDQIMILKNKENLLIFSRLYKNKGLSIAFISKSTNLSLQVVKNRVKIMAENSICNIKNELIYSNANIAFPDLVVKAFEMKLTDIKKAINQAVINKKYCDYSYVVMPRTKYNLCMKYSEVMKNNNIGLLLVDEISVKEIIRAKRIISSDVSFINSKLKVLNIQYQKFGTLVNEGV